MADENLELIAFRLSEIERKVDSLGESVRGNGKPGLALQIAQCQRDIEESKTDQERIRKEVIMIRQDGAAQKAEIESFKNRLKGAALAMAIFGFTSGGGLVIFFSQLLGVGG